MANIELKTLNDAAKNPRLLIREAEASYHNRIAEIADAIVKRKNVRAVLLAGPSGSGKTTTANLLADAIKARGEDSSVISLDDFYRDATDTQYPRTKCGERDFECPEALNLLDLQTTLYNITTEKPFMVPKYDFKVGGRSEEKMHPAAHDSCIIIEGLHALNPKISEHLPNDRIMKIFVSVSTNIVDGGERILSGRKLRFARRLVRDSIYRASDAKRTLSMWENVLDGENKFLYPYKASADVAFDTFHGFEPGILRSKALQLLTASEVKDNEYAKIVRNALEAVIPINDELVPKNSLLREFIAGGIYHNIYK